jgi:hypothetical protein
MVGLIKDNNKVPFISLADFIDNDKLNAAKQELAAYKEKQDNEGAEVFIGYNGSDWAEDEFQQKQKEVLPATTEYISSFCSTIAPFNIRFEDENSGNVLLHQDMAPFACAPWDSLIPNYKESLEESIHQLLKNSEGFTIVDNIESVNSEFNGLDFDYDSYLKQGDYYHDKVKSAYKLHLVMSDTKTLCVYDNVEDKIYNFTSPASIFNAHDYHDTRFGSHGISIQFPMSPYFLKNEIKEYLELA